MKKLSVAIPFSGFYETWVGVVADELAMDEKAYQLIDDFDGCIENLNDDEYELILNTSPRFTDANIVVAKEYTNQLLEALEIKGEFDELVSPKFYNFGTDKIYVSFTMDTLKAILTRCDKERLSNWVFEALKSRDGFIPFYSNKLEDWGSSDDYEAPQWEVILDFYTKESLDTSDIEYIENGLGEAYYPDFQ